MNEAESTPSPSRFCRKFGILSAAAGEDHHGHGGGDQYRGTEDGQRYPEIGHTYTPEMRKEMLVWMDKWLK